MKPFSQELLTQPISSREQIETNFKDILFTDEFPSALRFKIAVPTNWGVAQITPVEPDPEAPLAVIARLRPSASDSSEEITVYCAFLPREMHPMDWLHAWVTSQGFEVMDERRSATVYGVTSDLLAYRNREEESSICRLSVFKDADHVFLIQSCAPKARFEALSEAYLMAVLRFRLLEPTKQKLAEQFEWATLSSKRFLVPASWIPKPTGDNPPGGAALQWENRLGEAVVGTLTALSVGNVEELKRVEAVTLEKLAGNGYKLSHSSIKILAHVERPWGQVEIAGLEAIRDNVSYALRLARLQFETGGMLLVLLSPTAEVTFEAWSINRRAFEIAMNSVEDV